MTPMVTIIKQRAWLKWSVWAPKYHKCRASPGWATGLGVHRNNGEWSWNNPTQRCPELPFQSTGSGQCPREINTHQASGLDFGVEGGALATALAMRERAHTHSRTLAVLPQHRYAASHYSFYHPAGKCLPMLCP